MSTDSAAWAHLISGSGPRDEAELRERMQDAVRLGPAVSGGVIACSITEIVDSGYRTPVSSDTIATDLDQAQYDAGDGPCIAAARAGRPVHLTDIDGDGPYGRFGAVARQRGVLSSLSVPLTGYAVPAALNLYGRDPDAFADRQARQVAGLLARSISALAAAAARPGPRTDAATGDAPNDAANVALQEARTVGALVRRAQHTLMASHGLDARTAFSELIKRSRRDGLVMADVARGLLATEPDSR